jgi:FeS assembly SUF system protein
VGLFSFLGGKKEEAPQASAPSPVTVAAAAAAAEAAPGDAPPIDVPPGWDVGAFTAPPATPPSDAPQVGPLDPARTAELQPQVVEALKTVYDPEIPVDIYELGLVYEIIADADSRVLVKMTLTSPACPSAQQIPSEARYKIKALDGVKDAWVEIVWEPPWGKERMSESAKLALGMFD